MTKENFPYIHGFSQEEQDRLRSQARFSEHTIYRNINFSSNKNILEIGCGVGAQTEILLRRFPDLNVTGIDSNERQLSAANESLAKNAQFKGRYKTLKMDATKLDFKENTFDGAFLCWVLEHIPSPQNVLKELSRVCQKGSKVYFTEVLNSSLFLDPYSPNVWKYWMAFNDYQYEMKGDPFIGAKMGNLLLQEGFQNIEVDTITWHLDNRHPQMRKEYLEYWTELVMSASEQLIKAKVVDQKIVDAAKKELDQVKSNPNAVIYDSFIQAKATVG